MYHKIRITAVSLVVIVICILSSAGTLSYFTDTDGVTNNFTLGNAATELKKYGDVSSEEPQAISTEPVTDNSLYAFHLQARNIGNIPVYQRFRVVIPIEFAGLVTLTIPDMEECTLTTAVGTMETSTCSNDNYTVTYDPSVEVENVATYAEYYIVSKAPLVVDGLTAEWPTSEINFGNISSVENYRNILSCGDDVNNCVLGIGIYSDVIQTAGFADGAVEAFENFTESYNN